MKKCYLYLALTFFALELFAQPITWQREYSADGELTGRSIVRNIDGGYTMCGQLFTFNPIKRYFYVICVNSFGDTIWTKKYLAWFPNKIIQTRDLGYVIVGWSKANADEYVDGYIIKIDRYGNFIWDRYYWEDYRDVELADVVELNDGFMCLEKRRMSLIRTDNKGMMTWKQVIDSTGQSSSLSKLFRGFLLSGSYSILVDSVGNQIRSNRSISSIGGVISNKKNGYVFACRSDSTTQGIRIVFTDSLLNITTEANVFADMRNIFPEQIISTISGYAIAGQTIDFDDNTAGYILKLSNSGIPVFQREYRRSNHWMHFQSIDLCSDQGFITVGDTEGTEGKSKFIVTKTDSSGYTIPLIVVADNALATVDFARTKIYPNPFNGNTQLQYEIKSSCYLRISVFDINGKQSEVILNQNVHPGIHTLSYIPQKLSSGVYFFVFEIESNDKIQLSFSKKFIILK